MKYHEFAKKSDELVEALLETEDEEEKHNLKKAWFEAAVEMFNEELAGEIKLADGRVITILEI